MSKHTPLSRRHFLRGTGGILIGLPFLEAMMPVRAWGAPVIPRMVVCYGGVPTYFQQRELPLGALGATLPAALAGLAPVRQHVSVLTNLSLPIYFAGAAIPPGGCLSQQHYTAPNPSLAGMPTIDAKPMMYQGHTADQVVADAVGPGSKFKSIQACVQTIPYNGTAGNTASGGQVSSRFENGQTNVQQPVISPLELFTKLFSGTSTNPVPAAQVSARKSVLDLVLGDATRLSQSLSGADKVRMDQHFTEIRAIERSLASAPATGGGNCVAPAQPGADVAPSTRNFGGWANETLRRDQTADILALALACDFTRAMSWQLTYDQCFLGSKDITGIVNDLHQMSHDVNNDTTGTIAAAMRKHYNWHVEGFARLVGKLASLPEGTGTVLDSTFLGMCMGEGTNAHNRVTMHALVAGCKDRVKLGEHINVTGEHTAKMWISGFNALGINKTTLGQISGPLAQILK